MMNKRIVAAVFCVLCGLSSVSCTSKKAEPVIDRDPLVSQALITEAGWTKNWQTNLSLQPGEKIDRLGVLGSNLYVMTDDNIFYLIDRKNGYLRHSLPLTLAQLPVQRPFYYDEKLWFLVGSEIRVFDPKVGSLKSEYQFHQFAVSSDCALARNTESFYISGADNRLHVISADGYWQRFSVTADNDSPIVSVQATDQLVVFATKAGNVVGMDPQEPTKLWQYDTTGRIKGQLVRDGRYIYLGSFDTKLYKLDLETGSLAWKNPFHSGAPIRDSFAVGQDVVYLYNKINGVYGVSKETGQSLWQVPSGRALLAETAEKAFIYEEPGQIKVMNNASGEELYSVNLAEVQVYAVNTTDPVIYVADKTGRLMSISVN